MNIIWAGNQYTNKSDRRGHTPIAIVNHISEGSAQSCISWFTTPRNKESSAHFLVAKDGTVYQFVRIEDNAWANGLTQSEINISKNKLVIQKKVNPNWWTVSIEHEGVHKETTGALTDLQLKATQELHRYIIDYVKASYNHTIEANRDNILLHSEIDPIKKPLCPGELFPIYSIIQFLSTKEKKITVEEAIKMLEEKGVILSPQYWRDSLKYYNHVDTLLINVVEKLILNK